jgi:non-heme chloroperoxidase
MTETGGDEVIELPYVEQGDATGVPVVMLHGATDCWRSFEPVLPHLPDDIRAIAVTQRGHGDAPKPESAYLVEDLAGDVVDLMDELAIERAVLVGHSMGSWVARQIALDHPDRVEGLVLAGAFRGSLARDPEAAAAMKELADVPDPVTDEIAREFQVSTLATPIAAEQLDTFVAESLKLPARVWRELFLGFAELDQGDGMAELAIPALLVWGDRDAFIPREVQDELLDTLPDARLTVYEGVGHAVHWERPKRFAAEVAAFSRCSAGLQLSR